MFKFQVISKDKKSRARAGIITTPHGVVNTPSFVPVGTKATVKGMTPTDLKEIGVEILFANTYHLHLRPGEDIVKEFGGVSKFMNWKGVTITDSGGFQVFSLGQGLTLMKTRNNTDDISVDPSIDLQNPALVKINEDGVEFRSHIDGSKHLFTPEKSIEIQKKLGADLILAFDECAPHTSTEKYAKEAMIRTHNWLIRCIEEFNNKKSTFFPQALYGIIQGGMFEDLRIESTKFVSKQPTFGIAIGGVSVGESKDEMRKVLDWVSPILPEEKPRHLLGIGEIDDIFEAVDAGMDTFDCVIPTRFGRYGIVFVSSPVGNAENKFRIDMKKSVYAKDKNPIDEKCKCYTCLNFTRAYLSHLFKSDELLAYRLASYHNLYFLINLTKDIRTAILEERFGEMKKEWLK